ncbi:Putative zincin peptidase [Catalinimonas alkaloidigena]|uniref:Putative zincin peptidase n=1 Tax=Catalinimonas alkaloidigena TaxID=1075417 RepID=A0A1G9EGM1_9BACT|nr:DUF3267 domain-containing protein [Catalinimonas alkaloidigena]SDK75300.1 Putative zincin peptidase [Catalinimonas alkaloidigena]
MKAPHPRPTPTDLANVPLHRTLPFDDMVPFVREALRDRTWASVAYFAVALGPILVGLLVVGTRLATHQEIPWDGLWQAGGWAALFSFTLLIPIHELLHAAAYKLAGAPRISFGAQWRQFVFYAAADRFVVTRRELVVVALTPFLVITLVTLLGAMLVPGPGRWFFLAVFVIHTSFCGGDFGIVSYLMRHRPDYSYDDLDAKKAYFFKESFSRETTEDFTEN